MKYNEFMTIYKDGLVIKEDLDLEDAYITSLPSNLKVGGNLLFKNVFMHDYPVVYDCGNEDRVIYLDFNDKNLIQIGCFKATKDEAIARIKENYLGEEQEKYIEKIEECFNLYKKLKGEE